MGRNVEYNKNIKRQQVFNNDLANEHKSKTTKMAQDDQDDNDPNMQKEEGGILYQADPQITQRIQEVIKFKLGQTIDDVRGNAQILSGIAQPSTQV